jgi:hypothetical protein
MLGDRPQQSSTAPVLTCLPAPDEGCPMKRVCVLWIEPWPPTGLWEGR